MNINMKINKENKSAINEYMEVEVNPKQLELFEDCYNSLGWTITNINRSIDKITMRLQRDKKIKNHEKLAKLQVKCEDTFQLINNLEESKTAKAKTVSMRIGIAGTIFIACSVFAYLTENIRISIGLLIPGFIGWGLSYFLYKSIKTKDAAKVEPIITQNYELIYEVCKEASSLIKQNNRINNKLTKEEKKLLRQPAIINLIPALGVLLPFSFIEA